MSSSTQTSLCITEPPGERLPGQSKPTVLVVDDDPAQLNLLALVLSEECYVLRASSGQQALHVVDQAAGPLQLFLFDYNLGEMTGLELYDCLHARPAYEGVPAILVSCYLPQPEELDRRTITGITKPYDLDVLLAQVEAVISTAH